MTEKEAQKMFELAKKAANRPELEAIDQEVLYAFFLAAKATRKKQIPRPTYQEVRKQILADCLKREQQLLDMRASGLSLTDCAKELKISRTRVCQLYRQAMRRRK